MSQKEQVLKYLKKGRRITPLKALNMFNSLRLSAIIHKLRRIEGYDIQDRMIKTKSGKWVKEYWL